MTISSPHACRYELVSQVLYGDFQKASYASTALRTTSLTRSRFEMRILVIDYCAKFMKLVHKTNYSITKLTVTNLCISVYSDMAAILSSSLTTPQQQ